jgi:hypothetical protein
LEAPAKVTYAIIPANPGSGPGQAPESRIFWKSWIPGRAALAWNDDFPLLSKFLQDPLCFRKFFLLALGETQRQFFLG